jgi:hypothetical protein
MNIPATWHDRLAAILLFVILSAFRTHYSIPSKPAFSPDLSLSVLLLESPETARLAVPHLRISAYPTNSVLLPNAADQFQE